MRLLFWRTAAALALRQTIMALSHSLTKSIVASMGREREMIDRFSPRPAAPSTLLSLFKTRSNLIQGLTYYSRAPAAT
jgi:hypothetical protein